MNPRVGYRRAILGNTRYVFEKVSEVSQDSAESDHSRRKRCLLRTSATKRT